MSYRSGHRSDHHHPQDYGRTPPRRPAAQAAVLDRDGYAIVHAGKQVRVGPVVFWIVVGTIVILGMWSAATATYFAFRDDVLTRLIARQAEMQYAYEDRIAELRAKTFPPDVEKLKAAALDKAKSLADAGKLADATVLLDQLAAKAGDATKGGGSAQPAQPWPIDKLKAEPDLQKRIAVCENLLKQNKITSKELCTLYKWMNGIGDDFMNENIEVIELFPEGIMYSLREGLDRYKLYTQSDKIWEDQLFPIFTSGGGDYLLLDISQNKLSSGMVFLYAPSLLLSEYPESIYDSLESLFETIIACIDRGAYDYREDGTIDVDFDMKFELSEKLNPKSKYWQQT